MAPIVTLTLNIYPIDSHQLYEVQYLTRSFGVRRENYFKVTAKIQHTHIEHILVCIKKMDLITNFFREF